MDISAQFGQPTGLLGHLVGYALAFKNRERNERVAARLDLKPNERALEIGFGAGTDIGRASRTAAFVAGVDHSEAMVQRASQRNRDAIRDARVLKPGDCLLLAVQPRNKGANEETARQVGWGLSKVLTAAGFENVYCEFRRMRPVSTAAVLARWPK